MQADSCLVVDIQVAPRTVQYSPGQPKAGSAHVHRTTTVVPPIGEIVAYGVIVCRRFCPHYM